jgi:predicted nucleic acid-binding protein
MTTAVDTSVLLDLLVDDPSFASLSEAALAEARAAGRLIVCESVIAELRPALSSDAELASFLDELGLEFLPSPRESAFLAGNIYALYLKNRGSSRRVLPDFLIAAHAQTCADRLLARDRGYYREYFSDLVLMTPN